MFLTFRKFAANLRLFIESVTLSVNFAHKNASATSLVTTAKLYESNIVSNNLKYSLDKVNSN